MLNIYSDNSFSSFRPLIVVNEAGRELKVLVTSWHTSLEGDFESLSSVFCEDGSLFKFEGGEMVRIS